MFHIIFCARVVGIGYGYLRVKESGSCVEWMQMLLLTCRMWQVASERKVTPVSFLFKYVLHFLHAAQAASFFCCCCFL